MLILIKISPQNKPRIEINAKTNKYNSKEKSISHYIGWTNELRLKSGVNLHMLDSPITIPNSSRSLKFAKHYISTGPSNPGFFGKSEIDVEEMPVSKPVSISSTFKSSLTSKPTSISRQIGCIKSGQLIIQRKTSDLPIIPDYAELNDEVNHYNNFELLDITYEGLRQHIRQLEKIGGMIDELQKGRFKLFWHLLPSRLNTLKKDVQSELLRVRRQLAKKELDLNKQHLIPEYVPPISSGRDRQPLIANENPIPLKSALKNPAEGRYIRRPNRTLSGSQIPEMPSGFDELVGARRLGLKHAAGLSFLASNKELLGLIEFFDRMDTNGDDLSQLWAKYLILLKINDCIPDYGYDVPDLKTFYTYLYNDYYVLKDKIKFNMMDRQLSLKDLDIECGDLGDKMLQARPGSSVTIFAHSLIKNFDKYFTLISDQNEDPTSIEKSISELLKAFNFFISSMIHNPPDNFVISAKNYKMVSFENELQKLNTWLKYLYKMVYLWSKERDIDGGKDLYDQKMIAIITFSAQELDVFLKMLISKSPHKALTRSRDPYQAMLRSKDSLSRFLLSDIANPEIASKENMSEDMKKFGKKFDEIFGEIASAKETIKKFKEDNLFAISLIHAILVKQSKEISDFVKYIYIANKIDHEKRDRDDGFFGAANSSVNESEDPVSSMLEFLDNITEDSFASYSDLMNRNSTDGQIIGNIEEHADKCLILSEVAEGLMETFAHSKNEDQYKKKSSSLLSCDDMGPNLEEGLDDLSSPARAARYRFDNSARLMHDESRNKGNAGGKKKDRQGFDVPQTSANFIYSKIKLSSNSTKILQFIARNPTIQMLIDSGNIDDLIAELVSISTANEGGQCHEEDKHSNLNEEDAKAFLEVLRV